MSIHTTDPANVVETTDIVQQIQQFKRKVQFLPRDALLRAVYICRRRVSVCLCVCVCVCVRHTPLLYQNG